MDSKLKALKVADLRRILAHANVPVPARANKQDLVTRILDNPQAQDAYRSLHEAPSDPEPTPQSQSQPQPQPQIEPEPEPEPEPESVPQPQPTPADSPAQQPAKPLSPEEVELEKRKARAARFGIPLVEPAAAKARPSIDDPEKLNARAKRFGIDTAASNHTNPKKRSAPNPPVDTEELEKRRKRAERFGTKAPDASS